MLDVCLGNVHIEYIFCSCFNKSITRPIFISCHRFENVFPGPAEWKARLLSTNTKYPAGFMMNPLLAAANVIRHFAQNQTYHLTIDKLNSVVLPEQVNRQTTIYNIPKRPKIGAPIITTQSSEKSWRSFSRRDKTITNKSKNLALHPSTSVIS